MNKYSLQFFFCFYALLLVQFLAFNAISRRVNVFIDFLYMYVSKEKACHKYRLCMYDSEKVKEALLYFQFLHFKTFQNCFFKFHFEHFLFQNASPNKNKDKNL